METRFTPGPWNAKVDELVPERGAVYVEGPEGWDRQSICDCRYSDEGVERDEANAHLIAAAPDLYGALELARNALAAVRKHPKYPWKDQEGEGFPIEAFLDHALKKARGEI